MLLQIKLVVDGLNHFIDQATQVDPLFAEFHSVAAKSGHVQQIVQQPCHVPSLTLDYGQFMRVIRFVFCLSINIDVVQGVHDSAHWVSQFVREHGKKTIPQSDPFGRHQLRFFAFLNVGNRAGHANDFTLIVVVDHCAVPVPTILPVAVSHSVFEVIVEFHIALVL